jgi:hypothetical protein
MKQPVKLLSDPFNFFQNCYESVYFCTQQYTYKMYVHQLGS